MRYLILFILFAFPQMTFSQYEGNTSESYWEVKATSKVLVEGKSNVNEFQCVTLNYEGEDQLKKSYHSQSKNWNLTGSIDMKVKSFDCENRIMTRDLRETLRAEVHPTISIELLQFLLPEHPRPSEKITGRAKITLAGNSRTFNITWTLFKEGDTMRMLGTHDFKFSDFNLDPPTKMMGMIQVRDDITVDIDLTMEMISNGSRSD
nr:YceI family protein [Saprospiraceae bacterium]